MTMGGGAPAAALSADLAAWALIGAARYLKVDPIAAGEGLAGPAGRFARCAAAAGLSSAAGLPMSRTAAVMATSVAKCINVKREGGQRFARATKAAADAVKAHGLAVAQAVAGGAPEVPAEPALPPPRAPHPPVAGPITATIFPLILPKRPPPAGTMSARLLAVLAAKPRTAMSLASELGEKEAYVGQALSILRHDGLVSADPVPVMGVRCQLWRLTGDPT